MSELRKNIENYIGKCQKEMNRIEDVLIANSQTIYSQAKIQDRAIILEKVRNDLSAILKENEEAIHTSDEKIAQLESELGDLLFDVESQYEPGPVPGHGHVSVDCVLLHLYKMCDILGFDKTNRLPIGTNDVPDKNE